MVSLAPSCVCFKMHTLRSILYHCILLIQHESTKFYMLDLLIRNHLNHSYSNVTRVPQDDSFSECWVGFEWSLKKNIQQRAWTGRNSEVFSKCQISFDISDDVTCLKKKKTLFTRRCICLYIYLLFASVMQWFAHILIMYSVHRLYRRPSCVYITDLRISKVSGAHWRCLSDLYV